MKTAQAPSSASPAPRPARAAARPFIHAVEAVPDDAGRQRLRWQDAAGSAHEVLWRSESGAPAPRRMVLAGDEVTADQTYRWACEGTALLWTGDFHNARQLLQALARRQERAASRPAAAAKAGGAAAPLYPDAFHLYRKNQAQRSRILGMVLLPLSADYQLALRRAPDVAAACADAYGPASAGASDSWVSLREIQGLIGAYEWHRKGVPVAAHGLAAGPHARRGLRHRHRLGRDRRRAGRAGCAACGGD
ncbi:MAG: hypothetical protein GAK30_02508 [Paracidovorax wautersii]|uniref:Uncharacterized protein n=1 Tax=Paracidovorax wautersii TaxID=1177982 RepID=A0A7V8JPQ8_9BURK|nr:MAG: hypothetical protein GAK30_02508 [Paracidovorax wautersii]